MDKYILMVGKIEKGQEVEWIIAPPPVEEPIDSEAQRLLDEAEDTEDYGNWLLDIEDWSRGNW